MDEQLKARLIGAAVLVTLVVLLVPELLTGPRPTEPAPGDAAGSRSTRTYTIELGNEAGTPVATAPGSQPAPQPAPEEKRAAPVEAPAAPSQREPEAPREQARQAETTPEPAARDAASKTPTPEAQVPKRDTKVAAVPPAERAPEPKPAAKAAAPASGGGWAVQVGAFGSAASAQKLVKDLESDGYAAFISQVTRSGKPLHRVRVGPEADRAGADRLAARLKARGLPATVVAND